MDGFYLPEEILEWLGLKKSEYLSKLIVNAEDSDIQFQDYMSYEEFIPGTLALPDWSVESIEDNQRIKTICQSTLDETSVAVNSTVTDTARTCLIPTYKDNAGSSTYLGQPQCFAPQAGQIQMGQILKTRQGFTNSPINGVMVMKETALGAYFTCMDAYITFTHPQCPYGAKTNQYCDQMARSLMNMKCNNFKSDNSYIDIRLR